MEYEHLFEEEEALNSWNHECYLNKNSRRRQKEADGLKQS